MEWRATENEAVYAQLNQLGEALNAVVRRPEDTEFMFELRRYHGLLGAAGNAMMVYVIRGMDGLEDRSLMCCRRPHNFSVHGREPREERRVPRADPRRLSGVVMDHEGNIGGEGNLRRQARLLTSRPCDLHSPARAIDIGPDVQTHPVGMACGGRDNARASRSNVDRHLRFDRADPGNAAGGRSIG